MTQSYIFPIANWIYYWMTHSVKLKLIYRKFGSITTEFVQLLTSSHWTLAHHCQIIIHYNNSLHHCIYLYYFAWVLLYTVVCCKEKYTIRSIVCKASCHSVTRSLSHSVTRSLLSSSPSFSTLSLTDGHTDEHTDNIRTYRSASQTIKVGNSETHIYL